MEKLSFYVRSGLSSDLGIVTPYTYLYVCHTEVKKHLFVLYSGNSYLSGNWRNIHLKNGLYKSFQDADKVEFDSLSVDQKIAIDQQIGKIVKFLACMRLTIYQVGEYIYILDIRKDGIFVISPVSPAQWFARHYVSFEFTSKNAVDFEQLTQEQQNIVFSNF